MKHSIKKATWTVFILVTLTGALYVTLIHGGKTFVFPIAFLLWLLVTVGVLCFFEVVREETNKEKADK